MQQIGAENLHRNLRLHAAEHIVEPVRHRLAYGKGDSPDVFESLSHVLYDVRMRTFGLFKLEV